MIPNTQAPPPPDTNDAQIPIGVHVHVVPSNGGSVAHELATLRDQLAEREKDVAALKSTLDQNAWMIAAAKAQKRAFEDLRATIARQSAALGTAREALKPFVDAFNQSTDWAEVMDLLGDEQFQTARAAVLAIDEVMK